MQKQEKMLLYFFKNILFGETNCSANTKLKLEKKYYLLVVDADKQVGNYLQNTQFQFTVNF